jgi:hypothetical protein
MCIRNLHFPRCFLRLAPRRRLHAHAARGLRHVGSALLVCALAGGGVAGFHEQILTQTFFASDYSGGHLASGQAAPGPAGLRLDADSRLRFEYPAAAHIRSGVIYVRFAAPPIPSSATPLRQRGDAECLCAIKIRSGIGEVELSDRFIRIQRYGTKETHIDSVLEQRAWSFPRSGEHELRIQLDYGRITVALDNRRVLENHSYPGDFSRIDIATYKHPFTIFEYSAQALRADTLVLNRDQRIIEIGARFRPSRFTAPGGIAHHHFIAAKNALAGDHALFAAYVSDSAFYDALVRIGAQPGNTLSEQTWTERTDPRSPAPKMHARGSDLEIRIHWNNRTLYPDDILRIQKGAAYRFRFSGNRDHAYRWNSGCAVCLQSCPAGVVSNASHTIHDWVRDRSRFAPAADIAIEPEDEVVIEFSVKEQ